MMIKKKRISLKLIIFSIIFFNNASEIYDNNEIVENVNSISDNVDSLKREDIITNTTDEKQNDDVKKKNKLKFSNNPSFVAVGFDLFSLIYNVISKTAETDGSSKNSYIDCRIKTLLDFNKIVGDFSFGLGKISSTFKERGDVFNEFSFFLNPNIYYNFLKKNYERNVIYAGGGVNLGVNKYSLENKIDSLYNFNERSIYLWFNAECGCKTYIVQYIHLGVSLKFNFLKFRLSDKSSISKNREVSYKLQIYGFGENISSYNVEFSIYTFFNINLFDDEKVLKRESFV